MTNDDAPAIDRPRQHIQTSRGYLYVALAAMLWGTLGLFYRILHDAYHVPTVTIAFLRAGVTAILLSAFAIVTHRNLFSISRRDIPFFALYGLCGVTAFYLFYIQAVVTTNVTTAVVLLYTAPLFVALMALRFFGESINARKIAAIVMAFVGCALIARAYDLGTLALNGPGLFLGLGAGFTYALYTIFSKFALARHSSLTALIFALSFGALFLLPFQSSEGLAPLAQDARAWVFVLGLVLGPSIGSLALYNAGLTRVPASNASLVATLEPAVASVLAYFVLGERLEIAQMIGGGLVIGAAVWVRTGGGDRG